MIIIALAVILKTLMTVIYAKRKFGSPTWVFYLILLRTTVLTYLGILLKQKISCLPKTTKPFTSAAGAYSGSPHRSIPPLKNLDLESGMWFVVHTKPPHFQLRPFLIGTVKYEFLVFRFQKLVLWSPYRWYKWGKNEFLVSRMPKNSSGDNTSFLNTSLFMLPIRIQFESNFKLASNRTQLLSTSWTEDLYLSCMDQNISSENISSGNIICFRGSHCGSHN